VNPAKPYPADLDSLLSMPSIILHLPPDLAWELEGLVKVRGSERLCRAVKEAVEEAKGVTPPPGSC
jgi:hypothetical protein